MNQTRTTPTRHRDDGGAWRGLVVLPTADGQVSLLRDGVVRWRDGRIVDLDAGGTTTAEAAQAPRPGNDRAMLIAPAFVDLHCHWSQGHVRGRFSGNLLDWLRDSIWPAEAELADMARIAGHELEIAVDGGVKVDNAGEIIDAGATTLISGTGIFNFPDGMKIAIVSIRNAGS